MMPPLVMGEEETAEVQRNIAKAQELKVEGNEHFKAGDYKLAMRAYHQVCRPPPTARTHYAQAITPARARAQIYMYVHGYALNDSSLGGFPGQTTTPVSKSEMVTIRELKINHFCNLAMCHLKLGNLQKARLNCTKALAIDEKNVKALFRRGRCNAQLGALDEAKEDFEGVLRLDGSNKEAARELRALKAAFADHKRREAKKFAGMFEKLGAAEPSAEAPASSGGASSSADAGGPAAERATGGDAAAADDAEPSRPRTRVKLSEPGPSSQPAGKAAPAKEAAPRRWHNHK